MKRILIFGNSGSGKTTLARAYCDRYGIAHLDLDSLAWQATRPPRRKPLQESELSIRRFLDLNPEWVIEGCYADLLELVESEAEEIIFLNPGVEQCVENCKNRPWEPHKYSSPAEQDKNLEMLISWVQQYPDRTDEFSLRSHQTLYRRFKGRKVEHTSNVAITS